MLMSMVHAAARSCVHACVLSEETEIEWVWTGDGEELRRVEGRETIVRIYQVRKKIYSQQKKEKEKLQRPMHQSTSEHFF